MRAQFSADILLVEDEANDAEMVLAALRKRNIPGEVVHLTDGDQFMDSIFYASLYSSWHDIKIPRVILLDLKLKTVNGLDVLRLLKADARARTIPVVVFTASEQEIERLESYQLGVNSYVIKPTDADKFMEIVGDIGHYWLNVNRPVPH
jgi:DNA-binding response OmpR family regulator